MGNPVSSGDSAESTRRLRHPRLGRGAGWNAYLASAKQRENPPERFLPNRITTSG